MPRVTFRNLLEDTSDFKEIDKEYLTEAIYEYARIYENTEVYNSIVTEKITIHLNGEVVKVDDWAYHKVREDDEVVVTAQIGDDSGILQIVAGAALIAVGLIANYFAPGNPASQWLIGMGVALMLGGISALMFQPDLPIVYNDNTKSSQTYRWGGISTMARTNTPIPVVYGTHKVGGNIISLFTESYGDDNYLNMLIALCEGEIDGIVHETNHASVCTTTNMNSASYKSPAITLDDQPMRVYDDVLWWYRKGTNSKDPGLTEWDPSAQNAIPNFDGARTQYDDGRTLTTDYTTYTTTKAIDRAAIQVHCPSLYNSSSGTINPHSATYQIEYSLTGLDSWTVAEATRWSPQVSYINANVNLCTCDRYRSDVYTYNQYKPQTYTLEVIDSTLPTTLEELAEYPPMTYWQNSHKHPYTIKYSVKDSAGNIVETDEIQGTYEFKLRYVGRPDDGGEDDGGAGDDDF